MTNNTRNAIYACLLLLAITVGACVKDSTVPESIHKQPQDFKFSDARAFFEENAKMPANSSTLLSSLPTKSTDDDTLSLLSYFTVLWDNVQGVEMPDSYVYEIPLLHNIPLSAALFAKSDSGFVHTVQDVNLQSNLIIRKFHKTGKIRMFISTAVGRNLLPDSLQTHTSPLFWTGNKTHFEGYEFYTALNGVPIHYSHRFKDGIKEKIFLKLFERKEDVEERGFIFAQLHSHTITKSGDEGNGKCRECGEELDRTGYCSECGYVIDDMKVVGEVENCPKCGLIKTDCECAGDITCDICGSMICICAEMGLPCPYCDRIGCKGECQNNPPDNGGNGDGESQTVYLDLIIDGLGIVTGAGPYKPGTNVKITALANPNNIFGGWSEDGTLLSDASSYTFNITDYRCLTANFYQEGSECWNLYKKYKYNTTLHNSFNNLFSDISQNNNREYLYKMSQEGQESRVVGTENSIEDLDLQDGKTYSYLIHNHPKAVPLPSLGDLYQLYKASNQGYLLDKCSFIIYTINGSISFEIIDQSVFNAFINNQMMTNGIYDKNKGADFNRFYFKQILQVHSYDELQCALDLQDKIDDAIKYFSFNKGLRVAYTKDIPTGHNWEYAQIEGENLKYKNCLK